MNLHRLIVHELQKEHLVSEAHVLLSETLMPINADSIELVSRLDTSFNKDSIYFANFKDGDGFIFRDEFINYSANNTDAQFIYFTSDSIRDLRNQIMNVVAAKGGYIVFIDYTSRNGRRYLGVFLIRDTDGMLFNYDQENSKYLIDTVTYLNTNKLAMACRIDLEKFNDAENNRYMSFFKRGEGDISEYFTNWIAANRPESSKHFTDALVNVLGKMELPINPDTNETYEIDDFNSSVYSYINSLPGKIVNLKTLGLHFYNDEEWITNYISNNDIEIDTEFRVHGKALSNLKRFALKAGSIRLNFSKGDIARDIVNISDEDKVIITQKDLHDEIARIISQQNE